MVVRRLQVHRLLFGIKVESCLNYHLRTILYVYITSTSSERPNKLTWEADLMAESVSIAF